MQRRHIMNNSTSRPAAIATSPARPPLPRSAIIKNRRAGVRSTPSNTIANVNRRQSNPMAYSTITSSSATHHHKSPTPSLLSPLALTAVKSFGCGSHEFLQLGSSSGSSCESSNDYHYLASTTQHLEDTNNNNGLPCVNYDTNPTPLYLSIQSNDWSEVITRASTHPTEVLTFVSRYEVDDTTLRWKILPIHAAIIFNAPYQVVEALINVDNGIMCVKEKDDQGKLPLHLCLRTNQKKRSDDERKNNVKVVRLLLDVYPESVSVLDGKGRTPLMLVDKLPVEEREDYIRLFDNVEKNEKMAEGMSHSSGVGNGLSIKTNEVYSTTIVVPSSNTKPPRVPTATIRERRRKASVDSSATSKKTRVIPTK